VNQFSIDYGKEGTPGKMSPALYFGLLPLLLLTALVISEYLFLSAVRVYEPEFLLPLLNTAVFLAACVVAYIARQTYLISGLPTILWIDCGVLTLALGALTAGWLIIPFGPNVNVTIFNLWRKTFFFSNFFVWLSKVFSVIIHS
jgi:hypothetical protein